MSSLSKTQKNGLTVKDLVTAGIFTALVAIAFFIGGIPFGINPTTTFYQPLGSALLGGPIYLLLIAKAPKRGVLSIVGILIGLLMFFLGMHWGMDLGYAVCGIVADIVAGTKQYKSIKMNILAYSIFVLGASGAFLIYFINPTSWIETMLSSGGATQSYVDAMSAAMGPIVPVITFGGTIVAAIISGLIGKKLLKKQFEKAGITA